ncbi:hypothetical protein MF1_10080 [Bartonella quintana]|nr:hypothetical protein MF1_10080 [Bartonella quintana]
MIYKILYFINASSQKNTSHYKKSPQNSNLLDFFVENVSKIQNNDFLINVRFAYTKALLVLSLQLEAVHWLRFMSFGYAHLIGICLFQMPSI